MSLFNFSHSATPQSTETTLRQTILKQKNGQVLLSCPLALDCWITNLDKHGFLDLLL